MSDQTTTSNFKQYRKKFGYTNQGNMKIFFKGKDLQPAIDYKYIKRLNKRLVEIVKGINKLVPKDIYQKDIDGFCDKNITSVFKKLKQHKKIATFNNQGRRPEEVYFSWMRGYVIVRYFYKALSKIFEVKIKNIISIGGDDLENINSFKRSATSDLKIQLQDDKEVRVEVQAGFTGLNDIKEHKVLEAKKVAKDTDIASIVIHFDLFNGQVAFVRLDSIKDKDNDTNWVTRNQMEGQSVFIIDQKYFIWKLTENPPSLSDLFVE